ncbi:MAG: N-acetyltransferase [Cyanobacteria bacterium]|nr:N-acetyltransferase [Cyanobacteriota bacterium]
MKPTRFAGGSFRGVRRTSRNELIEIRDEQRDDVDAVRDVNRQAFGHEQEGRIIDALRERGGVVLSLVAVTNGTIVGHIMFSPATVGPVLGAALGPMAVAPGNQRKGIGTQLVARGVEQLRNRGCPFIVVIGHPAFYARFGFQSAPAQALTCAWDVPAAAFMVNVLHPDSAGRLQGSVEYRTEFSTVE